MEREMLVQAVVTATRPFGELHKSVTLLSPETGLIQAVIYGGRKGKKTALAPLFSFGKFQLYHNPVKNEYSVKEAEYTFIPSEIMKDLVLNCTASYFCETASRIKTDSPENVYNLLTLALTYLEKTPSFRKKILIDYTWQLLKISGIGSDMTTCPSCDRPYDNDETLKFSASMLTPVCIKCSDSDHIILPPGARRYLAYTFTMSFEQALGVELYETAQARLSGILLAWINAFCQYPLKTIQTGLL